MAPARLARVFSMLPFGSIRTVFAAVRPAMFAHEGVGGSTNGNGFAGRRKWLSHRKRPGGQLPVHASRQVAARE